MNQVALVGRLTRDPSDGIASSVVKFNIAVPRKFKKGDYTADFINCTAFGKTGEIVKEYFHKGSRIGVVGRIQTGHYEKNGQTIYTWDVIAESVEFVDKKSEEAPQQETTEWVEQSGSDEEELPFF